MSFNAFDISASGLYAQRVKMDAISSNIANVNTTRRPDGTPGPYARKQVTFAAAYNNAMSNSNDYQGSYSNAGAINKSVGSSGSNMMLNASISFDEQNPANGVKVSEVADDKTEPFKKVYDPGHPDADANGFVTLPNVNVVTEMVDMITASRAYEANVTAMNATKSMISSAMKI